jgi:hypothetical protein
MRRVALAVSFLAVGIAAASCGSDGKTAGTKTTRTTTTGTASTGTSSTDTPSPDISAVRQALSDWGQSDTAQEACALMSARIRRGLLDHDAAACKSKKKLEALLGIELKPTELKVKKVRVAGDDAVASVKEPIPDTKGQTQTQLYYLVKESGSWKVDSVGQPGPGAPSLPLT